jgi:adenosylcobinamide-phosphate guanylyltransferase
MSVTALVMAGGKGTRMSLSEEKPLLRVGTKTLIEHVLSALKNAERISDIAVAVSRYTPRTARLMHKLGMSVIKTPGKGFVPDMGYAVRALGLKSVLAISADLPLIKADIVDGIVEFYEKCGKPALSVVVPMETKTKLGIGGKYGFELNGKQVFPAGINLIDGLRIDEGELKEEICMLDLEEVAVNINTARDLRIANELFQKNQLLKHV